MSFSDGWCDNDEANYREETSDIESYRQKDSSFGHGELSLSTNDSGHRVAVIDVEVKMVGVGDFVATHGSSDCESQAGETEFLVPKPDSTRTTTSFL